MRPFIHINAATLDEAAEALTKEGAVAIAGGGDLLGALKDDIFPEYPGTVVNLKSIPDMAAITADGNTIRIGALATLADIARSPVVQEGAKVVAEAAGKASSPSLRETTTIGGNVCQLPRCWYFRKLNNRFFCARKGGERCFAASGDNRYHSVFGSAAFDLPNGGGKRMCLAVNQSELALVLAALGAKMQTTRRQIEASDFFSAGVLSSTVLELGEILTEVQIPASKPGQKSCYKRFAFRKSIDFPVINLAISVGTDKSYSIYLGGVAPVPYRAEKAEALLQGCGITQELAEKAGLAAADGARPFEANSYKVQLIKTLVKRELISL